MSNILVVDDRPLNRQFLVSLLRYKGHQLSEATDGAEALELARALRPDLIISDIRMPTMDGYEFVERLRADPTLAHIAVMFYTATYHDQEVRERAVGYGISHVLTKPAAPRLILDTVQAILSDAQLAPEGTPSAATPPHSQVRKAAEASELQAMSVRLNALVELGLDLAAESDSAQLLERVCHAAQHIVGAGHAAIGITGADGARLEYFALSGADAETRARFAAHYAAETALNQPLPLRLSVPSGDPRSLGFPPEHPPVFSLLAVPLSTPSRRYGWLYFANKHGADAFSDTDERLALTLAAQAAIAYENSEHQLHIKVYAERLEHELAERQRAEEALQAMTLQLQRSNRELEDFAHIASHDLQEPLRKVEAFGDLLLTRYAEQLPAEARDYLERMRSAAQRMKRLITDLLELSRVATRAKPFEPVKLADIAREVVGDLEARIEETGGRVELGELPTVEGDPLQIRQLLQNLIGNALKFHAPGTQPVVAVSCHQRAEANGQHYELRVADNGIGFDQKYHDRIFAPFQRLHGRTQYEGSGIGLAICKRIAERHHGALTATSAPGQGATFYVRLPLKQPTNVT